MFLFTARMITNYFKKRKEAPIDNNQEQRKKINSTDKIASEIIINTIEGSVVELYKKININDTQESLYYSLLNNIDWQQEVIKIWGKTQYPKRRTCVYGDKDTTYRYSGSTRDSNPWFKELEAVKECIENITGDKFNFVLCNYYMDGESSIGYHSDDEKDLIKNSTIASLSLGTSRDFILKNKKDKTVQHKIKLNNFDLLLMKGTTQQFWHHSVPKRAAIKDGRINLTFRQIKIM